MRWGWNNDLRFKRMPDGVHVRAGTCYGVSLMNEWQKLQISKPISLNGIFGNSKKGRKRTAIYNKWANQSKWEIQSQNVKSINGDYQLELYVGRTCTRADIDNLIKPIADLLVKLGITSDDSKMVRCSSEFVSDRNNVLIMFKENKK